MPPYVVRVCTRIRILDRSVPLFLGACDRSSTRATNYHYIIHLVRPFICDFRAVPTISRFYPRPMSWPPFSAHTYIPRLFNSPGCFTVPTLCTYTDLGSRRYFGVYRCSCLRWIPKICVPVISNLQMITFPHEIFHAIPWNLRNSTKVNACITHKYIHT